MTNPTDACREAFEKKAKLHELELDTSRFSGNYLFRETAIAWIFWKAATKATAQRCVEICKELESEYGVYTRPIGDAVKAISQEFGLSDSE